MSLFQGCVVDEDNAAAARPVAAERRPGWIGAAGIYARRVGRHDMAAVHASIASSSSVRKEGRT